MKTELKLAAVLSFLVVFTFALIVTVASYFNKDWTENIIYHNSSAGDYTSQHVNKVLVQVSVEEINVESQEAKVEFTYIPSGDFGKLQGKQRVLSRNIKTEVNLEQKEFSEGKMMASQFITFPLSGHYTRYPLDVHTSDIKFTIRDAGSNDPVDVGVEFDGNFHGYAIHHTKIVREQNGEITIHFKALRSKTTIWFSVFVVAIMWILTIIMFILSLKFLFNRTIEVYADLVSLYGVVLFSLPSIRSAQPNIPSIGITIDIIGFVWNMFGVSVGFIIVLLVMLGRNKKNEAEGTTIQPPVEKLKKDIP